MTHPDRIAKGMYWDRAWSLVGGCSKVSPGCDNCWSEKESHMRSSNPNDKVRSRHEGLTDGGQWNGAIRLNSDNLDLPLRVKKPTVWAVWNDLFHEDVPFEYIDRAFAVMSMSQHHVFLLLTKRPERMLKYLSNPITPHSAVRIADEIRWKKEAESIPYRIEPVPGFPDYLIDNHGTVFSKHGSSVCVWCGENNEGFAKRKYCSQKCKEKAQYQERMGRELPFETRPQPMSPDDGEDGHMRVMLYRDGKSYRELVHRIVLTVFDRLPSEGEEGMHSDGNPRHNHIANLSWGTQSDNWKDRLRHGKDVANGRVKGEYHGLSWPLPNVFCGVTAENQEQADIRIPILLQIPAAVRYVSVEPMLGPVNTTKYLTQPTPTAYRMLSSKGIDWVICGGESGPGARPMHPDWARSLRDQCQATGVPCFFKQWGEWKGNFPGDEWEPTKAMQHYYFDVLGYLGKAWRVGKKKAGRTLDGREWNEFPEGMK